MSDLIGAAYRPWRKFGGEDVHGVTGKQTLCTVKGTGIFIDAAEVTCAVCQLHIDVNDMRHILSKENTSVCDKHQWRPALVRNGSYCGVCDAHSDEAHTSEEVQHEES